MNNFLVVSKADMHARGWDSLDVILVSGDAYVDHPSYAAAVIGRVLESAGYRVGIIVQPNWRKLDDFLMLGKPKLFFGISAGNLDSMVANYTANKRARRNDDYSAGGIAGRRPDRASIVYANKIREAFPNVPIVLGGLEASLRRFAHFDFWNNGVRGSILLDSRADILVYGPGEQQILEIAGRLTKGLSLTGIRGTALAERDVGSVGEYIEIPSLEEVKSDKNKFNEAFRLFYANQDPFRGKTLLQKHAGRFVVQYPPAFPLDSSELDKIFELPFMYREHPSYEKEGGVPGFKTVQFSLISNRGCCGECSFCSLYAHQGRIIQSRSPESLLKEAHKLSTRKDFRGTITDIGGPTANLYLSRCGRWKKE
ncbi:MAG: YgiQ family radical SAM protein, partial [Candidatus Omnitrophica bacterium]|nr:YgiQ family radical SAM protein [Candidatus Omnitrophota bacterium]